MTKKKFIDQEEMTKKFISIPTEESFVENKKIKDISKDEISKVLLRIQKETYQKIKIHCAVQNITITDFINSAVIYKLEKEGE